MHFLICLQIYQSGHPGTIAQLQQLLHAPAFVVDLALLGFVVHGLSALLPRSPTWSRENFRVSICLRDWAGVGGRGKRQEGGHLGRVRGKRGYLGLGDGVQEDGGCSSRGLRGQ